MALTVGGSSVPSSGTVTFNGNAVKKVMFGDTEVWPGVVLVTGVTVSPSTLSIYAGHTSTLTATVTPSDADDTSVTWSSSNTSVATVSTAGLVTAKKAGSCTITATASSGVTATCAVTVKAVTVTGISADVSSVSINVGGTYTAHNCIIYYSDGTSNTNAWSIASWSSSDTSVATVTGRTITGIGIGTCYGYCSYGGYSDWFNIVVSAVEATSVTLDSSSMSLEVGDTGSLSATVKPSNVTDPTVEWSSSDSSVATVDSYGNVTAVGVGSCTITATCGSKSASCSVTVTRTLTGITLSPSSETVTKGDSVSLTATANYNDGSTEDVTSGATWSSSDTSKATVSDGTVLAFAVGSATITASYGGFSDTCAITVENPMTGLSLSSSSETVAKRSSVSLTATATYADGSTADVTSSATWTSSSDDFATVSGGTVTGVQVTTSSVKITAKYGGFSDYCMVVVESPSVTKLTISSSPVYVAVGETAEISLTATYADGSTEDVAALATWSSANTSIATVSGGTVTGVRASSSGVTITASYGGKSNSCAVAVVARLTDLTVSPSSSDVPVGGTVSLTATATFQDGSTKDVTSSATWSTSSSSVATVSKGTVTGVKKGSATITATYKVTYGSSYSDSYSDTCLISVGYTTIAITGLKIAAGATSVDVAETTVVTPSLVYSDGTTKAIPGSDVTWSSSSDALEINDNGVVCGIAEGSTRITAAYIDSDGMSYLSNTIKITCSGQLYY